MRKCNFAPCIPKGAALKPSLLLATVFLLLFPQMSSAQTPVALDGLKVIAERQYATDPGSTIDSIESGVYLASVRVYLFDSTEGAESTWETLVAAESVESDIPEDDDSVTYEKIDIEDVGDRAMVLSLSAELPDGETGAFRTMVVQKETTIVTVTIIAASVEDAEIADVIATAMIEREPGDDEADYDGMGGSTGGVWEIFLPADAEELGGLTAYADKEIRPA